MVCPISSIRILLALLLIGSGADLAAGKLKNPFKIIEPYKVTPLQVYQPEYPLSADGHVYGARSCGNTSSTVYEIRHSSCISGYAENCPIEIGRNGHLDMVFLSNETVDEYFIRCTIGLTEEDKVFQDIPMTGQKLEAGMHYLVTTAIQFSPEIQEKTFFGRTEIIRKNDNKLIFCAEGTCYAY